MTTQDYFLSMRLKPTEYQKLKQLCEDSRLPASTVIRINQIARKTNAGFATRSDMQELLYLMGQIELLMSNIADR